MDAFDTHLLNRDILNLIVEIVNVCVPHYWRPFWISQISTDHEDCVDKQYKQMFQQTRQKLRETEVQLEAFLRLKDEVVEVNALQVRKY